MATYKGIKGVKVVTKTSDPTASESDGTVWYNSTSPTALKYSIQGAGSWASGGALNTGRHSLMSAKSGIQTASIVFGGASPTYQKITEYYHNESFNTKSNTADLFQIEKSLCFHTSTF